MFNPLPYQEINAVYSADTVRAKHAHDAISKTKAKCDEAQRCVDKLLQESSEEELSHGWANMPPVPRGGLLTSQGFALFY